MATDQTTGRLLTVPAPLAVGPFSFNGAIKYDALGRIVVSATAPIFNFCNGLPFAADGALCVTNV